MEFIARMLAHDSPISTTNIKLLSELLQVGGCIIPPNEAELIYQRLIQEYHHPQTGEDALYVIEKMIPFLVEKDESLQKLLKREIFPQSLEIHLDAERIKKCNLAFKTDFSCKQEDAKNVCNTLIFLSSPYIMRLASAGDDSEHSFKLLMHLSVSSKGKYLKQVLTCLREFANSDERKSELFYLIQLFHDEELRPSQPCLEYSLLTKLYSYSKDKSERLPFRYHLKEIFWNIVQKGLINADSLRRKQSLFLLKRSSADLWQYPCEKLPLCVAFIGLADPQSDISERWETVIYLLETFEETQTHILQSSLPLLYSIADFIKKEELAGTHTLHFSWLLTLFNRLFSHESRLVQSWGIHAVLACPLSHSTQPDVAKFVTESLILAINNPSFFRGNATNLVYSIIGLFSQFLEAFTDFEAEAQLANIFCSLTSLSEIPLFYLSYSLSKMAPRPIIGCKALVVMRKLLSRTVLAHSQLLNRAIKCFLLRMLTHLINIKFCAWGDILLTLSDMELSLTESSEWKELNDFISKLICKNTKLSQDFEKTLKHIFDIYMGRIDPDSNEQVYLENLASAQRIPDIPSECKIRPGLPNKSSIVVGVLALVAETKSAEISTELDIALSSLTQILMHVGTHPYLSQERTARALTLASSVIAVALSNNLTNLKSSYRVYTALKSNLTEITVYLIEQEIGVELIQFVSNIREFQRISGNCSEQIWEPLAMKLSNICAPELEISSEQGSEIKLTYKTVNLFSLIALMPSVTNEGESSWAILSPAVKKIASLFPLLRKDTFKLPDIRSHAHFITAVLAAINMSHLVSLGLSAVSVASVLKELAVVTNYSGLVSIFQILEPLLPILYGLDPELCGECVSACWRGLREEATDSNKLHLLFPDFLRTCLSEELLSQCRPQSEQCNISSLMSEVIEWGENKIGALYIIVKHLDCIWCSSETMGGIYKHWQQIVYLLLTSSELTKPVRQQVDGIIFAHSLKEFDFSHWRSHISQNYSDLYRLELIGLLTSVRVSKRLDYSSLLDCIIQELLKVENERTAERGRSCVFNSKFHRDKLRTWQVFLLLLASLLGNNETLHTDWNRKLLLSLLKEHIPANSQPSIRCYIERAAALLIADHEPLLTTLLDEMRLLFSAPSLLPFVCVSYLLILSLLFKKITLSIGYLIEFSALMMAMMSSNNSQLRISALDTLNLLRQLPISNSLPLDSLLKYCPSAGGQAEQIGWVTAVGYEVSFSSVMRHLPLHFGLDVGDVGLLELADRGQEKWNREHLIPLGNANIAFWSEKQNSFVEERHVDVRQDLRIREVMQKKIMPWEELQGEVAIDLERTFSQDTKSNQKGQLILIASLIDKPTNLGGMCRTCEVFGVGEMVISNRKVLEDRCFTSLSVSAERWLAIKEVKVDQLQNYVQSVKEGGYTIIGLEQTPSSYSLDKFSFPRRSVLLVGHEKFGIPVELLEIMDMCIQIPQFGFIRSLNVHVSSAIAIWRYASQHLVQMDI